MHPSLVAATDPAAASAIPFVVVTKDSWEDAAARLGAPAARLRPRAGLFRQGGHQRRAAVARGRRRGRAGRGPAGRRPVLARQGSGRACPPGSTGWRPGRPIRRRRCWRCCSGSTPSPATRGRATGEGHPLRRAGRGGRRGGRDGRRRRWPSRRDLINTPANDLGPAELEAAARAWAARMRASFSVHRRATTCWRRTSRSSTPSAAPRRGRRGSSTSPGARPFRPQGDAGRQGRVLRHRRPQHQAGRRHAADEEGHGRARRPRSPPRR